MAGIVSCSDKDKIPAGVLPKDQMESVLWDMIQAERFTAGFMADSAQKAKAENFKLYAQIFSLHHISKEEFIKSYKFYLTRPDISREMFDSLNTRANRRREDMYKPQTPVDSTHKADSSNKPVVHPPVGQPATTRQSLPAHSPSTAPTPVPVPVPGAPQPATTPQNRPGVNTPPPVLRRAGSLKRLPFRNARIKDSLLKQAKP
jgi:hypothetical protein